MITEQSRAEQGEGELDRAACTDIEPHASALNFTWIDTFSHFILCDNCPCVSQIEFISNGTVPSDLSQALVLDRMELSRLQEKIKQLKVEKGQQRELYSQARQQRSRLIREQKDMDAKIQSKTLRTSEDVFLRYSHVFIDLCVGVALEKQCEELMMKKYGRRVDLETLQTLSGNRTLEELKQEKLLREAAYAKEIKQWDVCYLVCVTHPHYINCVHCFVVVDLCLGSMCPYDAGKGRRRAPGSDGGDQD